MARPAQMVFDAEGNTRCKYGHLRSPDLDYVNHAGYRECRDCHRTRQKRYRDRYRATVRGQEALARAVANQRAREKTRQGRQVKAVHERKYRYGLTASDFERMRTEQCDSCAICLSPFGPRTPCVDHCHKTGKVRGLLCHSCNKAIGHLFDDAQRTIRAARYLKRHNG